MFTLISMGFVAIPLIVSIFTGKQLAIKEKRVSDRNEVYVASVKDLLSGITVVKSFQAENQAISLYKASNRNLEQSKKERNRTSSLISTLGAIAQNMAQFGVLLTGAWMVTNNISGLTVGMVMVFTTLMHFVIQPIATIPQLLAQRKSAVTLINKLAANLAHKVSDQGDDLILSNDTPPLIQVDQVFYSYTENKPALKDLSFDFMPGKSYAVVGGSGSGKSTLLNLLMGMDNGYRGSIQLNHQEVRDLSALSLYQTISQIQQNVFIFNATIRENITMFKSFPQDKVDEIINISGLKQLIQERGEEYLAGENGNQLSGGERQRIAIARALLRESLVLLVDEATSSLDNQTANQISQAILDLDNLTRIVITHRLDEHLLSQYDGILVLKDGQLIEKGTYQELMEAKGYFYSLYVVAN